jgi:RNA polymerase sigma-70 factor (ECF subfamily)
MSYFKKMREKDATFGGSESRLSELLCRRREDLNAGAKPESGATLPSMSEHDSDGHETLHDDAVATLVANHERFLRFLQPRLGSRESAEELLQAAFVKGIERGGALREDESVVAWFYRLLRNALVDHYRHQDAEKRALAGHAAENPEPTTELETALEGTVCECVNDLVPMLKPEYAELLRRVDLGGAGVAEAAKELGITANNAGVRLHRAREALRRKLEQACGTCTEHGCLQCTCRSGSCS